jgi:LysM repeat protein
MDNKKADFSWGRPGAQALKDAGFTGVIRYLGDDTSGKVLNQAERDEYFGAGLDIRLVWEDEANACKGGHDRGVQDGSRALSQAQALGLPKGFGIYSAVDYDAPESDQPVINDYFNGFNEGLAGYYEGAGYGGYWPIKRARDAGAIKKTWQTVGWSGQNRIDGMNILQDATSDLNGQVDNDYLLVDDGWSWTGVDQGSVQSAPSAAPAPSLATPDPSTSGGPGGDYSVVSGDSLSAIGAKTGADWRAIAALNSIQAPYKIFPGEVLHLPGSTTSPGSVPPAGTQRYTVVSGDTLSAIGAKFGVDYNKIASDNGIADPNNISVGQVLVIGSANQAAPEAAPNTYTVQSGDWLSKIGSDVGVDWHAIAAINQIAPPFVIFPGQLLKLS